MQSSHELCPQPLGNLQQIKRKRQCKITYKQFQIVLEYAKLTDHFPTRHMHPTPTRLRAPSNLVLAMTSSLKIWWRAAAQRS
jgi:hypothetical protein